MPIFLTPNNTGYIAASQTRRAVSNGLKKPRASAINYVK
jgi:hypothetical protein